MKGTEKIENIRKIRDKAIAIIEKAWVVFIVVGIITFAYLAAKSTASYNSIPIFIGVLLLCGPLFLFFAFRLKKKMFKYLFINKIKSIILLYFGIMVINGFTQYPKVPILCVVIGMICFWPFFMYAIEGLINFIAESASIKPKAKYTITRTDGSSIEVKGVDMTDEEFKKL